MSPHRRRLGLAGYYLLEGLNALGTNVFLLGLYFHARIAHGFSDTANLLLAATQGAAYVLATRAGGRFADRAGPDRAIAFGLAGMSLATALGWRLGPDWALFAALALYGASMALTWPALEAAVARAPGEASLARRTGLYNVTWSVAGAAGFFAAGGLFTADPEAVFWVPLAAHALQLAGLAARGDLRHGGSVPAPGARQEVPRPPGGPGRADRARYLLAAWVANGLGYFLFGAFSALAPTLGERLGLAPRLAIWLVSSYLFVRSAAFVLFWRWTGWEYRRGWLTAALALPPAAFAALFATRSTAVALAALALLGVFSGLAYSASLHASLDRGGREGEGGGLHEWVIGLGILLGPLAGAAGTSLFAGTTTAGVLVAALGAVTALAGSTLLRRPAAGEPPGRTPRDRARA